MSELIDSLGRPGDEPLDLRAILRELAVPDDDVESAAAAGTLELLALERIVEGSGPRYDVDEVAELAAVDRSWVLALWRALGFPEPHGDEKIFSDDDLAMLADTVPFITGTGGLDSSLALQMTRVIGSSVSRVATAQVDAIASELDARRAGRRPRRSGVDADGSDAAVEDPAVEDPAVGDPAVGDAAVEPEGAPQGPDAAEPTGFDPEVVRRSAALLPMMPKVLAFVWRRHLAHAARRRLLREGDGSNALCVGFADLVGFTAQTQQLPEEELVAVVDTFEHLAHDVVTRHGGRVIKMIGDEVMFCAEDVATGSAIALDMAESYREEPALSDVRVGLAAGEVLEREGDLYGPVVNLANRIVSVAYPGAVVCAAEVADALEGVDGVEVRSIRSHYLKDVGRVRLWSLRRAEDERDDTGRYVEERRKRAARRQFLLEQRVRRQRGVFERAAQLDGLVPEAWLRTGAFIDEPTEEVEAITDAVLEADLDDGLQVELLADIEATRRLGRLEREAAAKARETDLEAERKIAEAEREARAKVLDAEAEARRKIAVALEEAEAKAARANEEASRKLRRVAADAERRAEKAERDADRRARQKARQRRQGRPADAPGTADDAATPSDDG